MMVSVTRKSLAAALVCSVATLIPGLPFVEAPAYAEDANQVDQIWTDFGGFWTSGNGSTGYDPINSTEPLPNTSHNLLAFAWGDTTYSTGVNDSLLTANSVSFTAANWEALPISALNYSINEAGSNCSTLPNSLDYFGPAVGAADDVATPSSGSCYSGEELASYLTDGTNGLDLGTAVLNVKVDNATISFPVLSIDPSAINDGVPDLLITQVAQAPTNPDTFSFRQADGSTLVGNTVARTLSNVDPVGNWRHDLYHKNGNVTSQVNAQKALRLIAFDFSDFGVTSANYSQIRSFQWTITDQTDTAFVGVNSDSVTVSATTEDCEDSNGNVQGTRTTQVAADNGDIVLIFTVDENQTGACVWTVPAGVWAVNYLLAGGGGGGGSGGGGAGEVATNWSYTPPGSSQVTSRAPLWVTPGDTMELQVGLGGSGGVSPTSGSASSLGSVSVAGGGVGGQTSSLGSTSGGGGAGSSGTISVAGSNTNIPGSTTFISAGGASASGRGGGGGGGAGATGASALTSNGADGGAGISSAITGSAVEYGCGGGGGVNANSGTGGTAGCNSSGDGANASGEASAATDDFGGGGGGGRAATNGAEGGNGVVVIRYSPVNGECPYDANNNPSLPLACATSISVVAGGSAVTANVGTTAVSYVDGSTTISSVFSPDPDVVVSSSSTAVTVTVSDANTDLVGNTYPVIYTLTGSAANANSTSTSYILVTITDPKQLTPVNLVAEPRVLSITLPRFVLGGSGVASSDEVLICVTPNSANPNTSINLPNQADVTVESRGNNSRGISIRGTRSTVEDRSGLLAVRHSSDNTQLFNDGSTVTLDVNVSVVKNGGNNQCTGGTASTITISEASLVSDQRFSFSF